MSFMPMHFRYLMFSGRTLRADKERQEISYQELYLKADISQSKLAMLLFSVPIVGFVFNDYMFFGVSTLFYAMISIRITLLCGLLLEFTQIEKVKSYLSYDKIIFFSTLAILIGGGVINATRSGNAIITSIITIVSIFVLYLVVPLKLSHQVFLASFATVGEALIILILPNTVETSLLFTLIFSMFVANLIAAFSALKMHSYRSKAYQEFIQRKALQDELETQANQLSDVVADQTKDLVDAQYRLMQSERLAAIGKMAGMVGHDLRNPLGAIKNASYFLRKKHGSTVGDSSNEMLTAIDRAVENANSIVADLLDFSREIHLDLYEYSPKSLINYVLLSAKVPSNVKITQNIQDQPTIWVDSNKIERVFINIRSVHN